MTSDFSSTSTFIPELPGPLGGAPQQHFDIKRMLRLRLPLILAVSVALAVPAVVAVFVLVPFEYEVSAELRFMASMPHIMSDERNNWQSSVPYEKFLTTQVKLISGDAILSRVLEDPEIRKMPALTAVSDPLSYLKDKVQARPIPNSELVTISFRATDKEMARKIVDTIVSTYMTYALNEEANIESARMKVLRLERDTRQNDLDLQLRQITELQQKIGIPLANVGQLVGPSETEAYRGTLAKAEEDLTHAESQATQTEQMIERLEKAQQRYKTSPNQPIYDLGIEDRVTSDIRVSMLRQQLVKNETDLAALTERRVGESSKLQVERENNASLKKRTASIESMVRSEVLSSLEADLTHKLDSFKKAAEDAAERKEKFKQFIGEHDQHAAEASTMIAELDELKMKSEETRSSLSSIRRELSQISIEQSAPARVQIASPPVAPSRPDYGKHFRYAVFALFGSMCAGMGMGLWRELTDQQLRSAQDFSGITRLPVLATIPYISEDRLLTPGHAGLLTANFPHSPVADEIRRILARIIYPPESAVEIKSCMVASPTRGDGKTSLACNLATSLARANRRVLLVDICPWDPSIELSFGMEPGEGLAEVLYGGASTMAVARETELPNLRVMGPGLATRELAGRLASRDIMEFLEGAEQDFDHVIIDTPPSLLMSDAKLLAPVVDGVIVVVGVGVSTLGMVRRCLREMEQVGAEIIGVVLNGIRPTRGGYLRANLDMYYGYGEQRETGKSEGVLHGRGDGDAEDDDSVPHIMLLTEDDETSDEHKGGK